MKAPVTLIVLLTLTSLLQGQKQEGLYDWDWYGSTEPEWYEPTEGVYQSALKTALSDVEEVLFAVRANGRGWHWYENIGYEANNVNRWKYGGKGGRLDVLNLRTGEVRHLINDPDGDVRDPAVHYDGKTILFSYRPAGENRFHLYTIQSDGSNLQQLTDSDEFDDYEPCWLPDGDIMFISTRAMRWVPCWTTEVGTTFRCKPDGSAIKQISFGVEHENNPWPLSDGRIAYTRWEYVNRDQVSFHGLWTFNPDGANQMVLLNNLGLGDTFHADPKPIPGTDLILSIASPRHGRNEKRGRIITQDPAYGPSDPEGLRLVDRGYPLPKTEKKDKHLPLESWRDPFPLSKNYLLAATLDRLVVMNADGDYEIIYQLPESDNEDLFLHEPRPLIPAPRPPVMPEVEPSADGNARMVLADVLHGRSMEGIEPGTIKKLLIKEELPRPISYCAYSDSVGNGYVLHRVHGTVPVAEDGSAYFEVPAGRPLVFVALDKDDIAVKHMNSFVSAMPGEQMSCVGCHEHRTHAPAQSFHGDTLKALTMPVSKIEQIEGVPQIIDYVLDIQPVWDQHCVQCHNNKDFKGGLTLSGDRAPGFTVSYHAIQSRRFTSNKGTDPDPYSMGTGSSGLLKGFKPDHYDVNLSPREVRLLKTWIDAGEKFAGTYGALGTAERGLKIKVSEAAADVMERRCSECHRMSKRKPLTADEIRKPNSGGWYNLDNPDLSLLLTAPLAKAAGGIGFCKQDRPKANKANLDSPPATIFTSKDDPDYQILRDQVLAVVKEYDQPGYWQAGYQPTEGYVREMIRYGAQPAGVTPATIDQWKADLEYFKRIYEIGPKPEPDLQLRNP